MNVSYFKKSAIVFLLALAVVVAGYFTLSTEEIQAMNHTLRVKKDFATSLNIYSVILLVIGTVQLFLYIDTFEKRKAFTNSLFVMLTLPLCLRWTDILLAVKNQGDMRELYLFAILTLMWIAGKIIIGGNVVETENNQQ